MKSRGRFLRTRAVFPTVALALAVSTAVAVVTVAVMVALTVSSLASLVVPLS